MAPSLIARAQRFCKLQFVELIAEARRMSDMNTKERAPSSADPTFTAGADAPKQTCFTLLDKCNTPTPAAVARCIELVKSGQVSRGMAALSASPVAPFNKKVVEELREKAPRG